MTRALMLALLLGACGRDAPRQAANAGARLEASAAQAGLIADPDGADLTGSWALDTDRACVVPGARRNEDRLGVLIDYGDGQGCAASGTVRRAGGALDVRLGACRVRATFDGERIVFPAELPAECATLCTGRASLESFTVEQVSGSASEAAMLRTPGGRELCGS